MGVMARVARWAKEMLPRRRGWSRLWSSPTFAPASFDRLEREGYRQNAAVNICVTKYAQATLQAPWAVVDADGERIPDDRPSALRDLLRTPNPVMGEAELRLFIGVYKAIGGQCYLHKVRDSDGQVVELWPYHRGQMWPVPGETVWIDRYEYDRGEGRPVAIDPADVIHLKWPAVDTSEPWLALAPLLAVAREVDTDSEATRYLYALLYNDAVPLTVVNTKSSMGDRQFERFRAQFESRHGGENRGRVALIEGEASISRLGLDFEQLAMDALRAVPEVRIANSFGMSAMYAGLSAGMERAIYNNVSEARRAFFEDTAVPHASLDDSELTAELGEELGGVVTRDWSNVVALRESADAQVGRAHKLWGGGLATRNESRRVLGLPPVEQIQLAPGAPPLPPGDAFIDSAQAPVEPQPVVVMPPKALAAPALQAKATTAAERRITRAVREYLAAEYQKAAEAVEAQA